MVDPAAWKNSLSLAKLGDTDAAGLVATLLLQWTRGELPRTVGSDEEDLAAAFVERMIRDQFAHLPDGSPARLEAFLHKCWRHFVINWFAHEERRRSRQLLWADWARIDDEGEADADMDDLAGSAPSPEQIVILREEIAALWSEVARLTPLNQQILALLVDEGLTDLQVSSQLGMNASTVRWHVYTIRHRLKRWWQARQG